jgi:hypothetical protein
MKVIYAMYGFMFLMLGGWCANIYKIIGTGFEIAQWGGMEVARVIGVFVAPLGCVLGFF